MNQFLKTRWKQLTSVSLLFVGAVLLANCGGGGSSGGGAAQVAPVASNGNPSVAARTAPLAGGDTDCPAGGILLETGIDENGNGVLDPGEIDKTEKICNGTPGADGAPGVDGAAGADGAAGGTSGTPGVPGADGAPGTDGAPGGSGLNSLVSLVQEFVGGNCPAGGIKINSGLDANNNGILDAAEITQTEFVCNGGDPPFTDMKKKLLSPDNRPGFGVSVSISKDYAIVGRFGGAQIYHRTGPNTWDAGIKVTVPNAVILSGGFGRSVSISGDYAIVGAHTSLSGSVGGAAYIYHRTGRNTWTDLIKITAPDAEAGDEFGGSVSISGNYAIVGASVVRTPQINAGAAYIYQRIGLNTWDNGTKIPAPEKPSGVSSGGESFGHSVSISGDYAIVGTNTGFNSSAFIYQRTGPNTWGNRMRISSPNGRSEDDRFGFSVAISGDTVIVGAARESSAGEKAGAAYLYHRTGPNAWRNGAKITAPNPTALARFLAGDGFGKSVAISGDVAIVGANNKVEGGVNGAGAAYIFK